MSVVVNISHVVFRVNHDFKIIKTTRNIFYKTNFIQTYTTNYFKIMVDTKNNM